jgi:hypothetical protein
VDPLARLREPFDVAIAQPAEDEQNLAHASSPTRLKVPRVYADYSVEARVAAGLSWRHK